MQFSTRVCGGCLEQTPCVPGFTPCVSSRRRIALPISYWVDVETVVQKGHVSDTTTDRINGYL